MLTYRIASTSTESNWLTEDEDYTPYGYVYFQAPNPDVARTFVEAFIRIDASTWTDDHTILNGEIEQVDGPADDYHFIYSWTDIQSDRSLCQEMFACSPA